MGAGAWEMVEVSPLGIHGDINEHPEAMVRLAEQVRARYTKWTVVDLLVFIPITQESYRLKDGLVLDIRKSLMKEIKRKRNSLAGSRTPLSRGQMDDRRVY